MQPLEVSHDMIDQDKQIKPTKGVILRIYQLLYKLTIQNKNRAGCLVCNCTQPK